MLYLEHPKDTKSRHSGIHAEGNAFAVRCAGYDAAPGGVSPMGGKKVAYLRVSTEDQNPDRQIDGLKALSDELHIETLSAVSQSRPVFDAVIAQLQPGDTLVVWDLDRAFRSTIDALFVAESLRERGVHFRIATMSVDTSTEFGELLYTVVAAFAQFERRVLIRRTREGMAAAKRRGVHVGRPYGLTAEQIARAHAMVTSGAVSLQMAADRFGVHKDTILRGFRRHGLGWDRPGAHDGGGDG